MSYKKSALKSISWMGLLRVSTRLISFVRLGILARILTPSQFGVFGIATLLLSLIETVTETGINIFLIQRKENISEYLNSAWFVSILRGILISLLIVILSPFVVRFFNSPESLVVILLISLVPFIRGFINPSIVLIQKDVQFHKEFWVRFILFLVDAIATLIVAFITKSAESVAIGLIVSALIEVIISYLFFKPYPSFKFEPDKINYILRRSWWVTLSGIFSYSAENGDDIVVGKMLNTNSLGIYQAAYKISTLPIKELTEVISKVVFPVYSKFSEDQLRLQIAFKKVFISTSLFSIMIGILIFIFSEQIVTIILGDQWLSAISVVRILAIYGILRAIFGNFAPFFLSIHQQKVVAKMTLFRLFGLALTIVPLVYYFGLNGAAYSALISIFVEIPVIIYYFNKLKVKS